MESKHDKKSGSKRQRPSQKGDKASRTAKPEKRPLGPLLNYKLLVFDTFKAAKAAATEIKDACTGCDQLNVAIRAEGDMDDQELLGIHPKVKVLQALPGP